MINFKSNISNLVIKIIKILSKFFIKLLNVKEDRIKIFIFSNISFLIYLVVCIIISICLNLFLHLFLFLFIFIETRRRFDELDEKLEVKVLEVEHDNFFNCTILSFLHVFTFLFLAYFFRDNILILVVGALLFTLSTIEFFNLNLDFINGLMYRNFKLKDTTDIIKDYYDKKEKDENIKEILEDIFLEFPDTKDTFEYKFKYHTNNYKIMQKQNISRETIYKRINKVLNIFICKNK